MTVRADARPEYSYSNLNWLTAVIMVREIGITVLRFAVLRRGVIPASRGGKLKTLVQAVAIGLIS